MTVLLSFVGTSFLFMLFLLVQGAWRENNVIGFLFFMGLPILYGLITVYVGIRAFNPFEKFVLTKQNRFISILLTGLVLVIPWKALAVTDDFYVLFFVVLSAWAMLTWSYYFMQKIDG